MKRTFIIFCILLVSVSNICSHSVLASEELTMQEQEKEQVAQGNDVFIDYQNYRHGYCPSCDCYPCKCNNCPPNNCNNCPSNSSSPSYPTQVPQPEYPTDADAASASECNQAPCADPSASCVQAPCAAPAAPCAQTPCAAQTPACAPCAPVCGTECGISICALGIGIAALATAAVLIVSSGNGSTSH